MPSDAQLVERWRSGDAHAGEALFERYYDSVARFFYNKVDHGVEDLVQQTFLACVESHSRYRGAGSFLTFLMGIARNILAGYYRKRERGRRAFDMAAVSVAEMSAFRYCNIKLVNPIPQPTSRIRRPSTSNLSIRCASTRLEAQTTPKSGQDAGGIPACAALP